MSKVIIPKKTSKKDPETKTSYSPKDFTQKEVEEYNELQRFKKLPLILCTASRNEVSVNAKVCPHCGQPVLKKIPRWKWFFYVPIMILGFIFNCGGVYGLTHGGTGLMCIVSIVLGSACVMLPGSKRRN